MNKTQSLLTKIANEAWAQHPNEEFRGLYIANDNEHAYAAIASAIELTKKTIAIELGFNYSDSTNLDFVFQGWNRIFGFSMVAVEAGANINSITKFSYYQTINSMLNKNFEEIQKLYNEEYVIGGENGIKIVSHEFTSYGCPTIINFYDEAGQGYFFRLRHGHWRLEYLDSDKVIASGTGPLSQERDGVCNFPIMVEIINAESDLKIQK